MEAEKVLIIAAHPDDEVIGAGARFTEFGERLRIVIVTDGSPQDLTDARNAGFSTREDYAAGRFEESANAALLARITRAQYRCLGFRDQEASLQLVEIARSIEAIVERERPGIIYTHPYEGGHPDHDATAFAVQMAIRSLDPQPLLCEFASYHAGPDGAVVTGSFLADPSRPIITNKLTEQQEELKRRMFNCYASQQHVLAMFQLETEAFRPAPDYDFTKAPHSGCLHYENYDWGMTGERFRELAAQAQNTLDEELSNAADNS